IPLVIRHMVGREITDLFPRRPPKPGAAAASILSVRNLSAAPAMGAPAFLRGISFELRPGEVLGFGGLMGAGRTELMRHLFGGWGTRVWGEVEVGGKSHSSPTRRESIEHGLVLVTEDRRRYGLVLEQSIGFNLSLSSLEKFSRGGRLHRSA